MIRSLASLLLCASALPAATRHSDLVVYGCTSGAITAAVQANRMGKSVVMVCPEKHLGGLSAAASAGPTRATKR